VEGPDLGGQQAQQLNVHAAVLLGALGEAAGHQGGARIAVPGLHIPVVVPQERQPPGIVAGQLGGVGMVAAGPPAPVGALPAPQERQPPGMAAGQQGGVGMVAAGPPAPVGALPDPQERQPPGMAAGQQGGVRMVAAGLPAPVGTLPAPQARQPPTQPGGSTGGRVPQQLQPQRQHPTAPASKRLRGAPALQPLGPLDNDMDLDGADPFGVLLFPPLRGRDDIPLMPQGWALRSRAQPPPPPPPRGQGGSASVPEVTRFNSRHLPGGLAAGTGGPVAESSGNQPWADTVFGGPARHLLSDSGLSYPDIDAVCQYLSINHRPGIWASPKLVDIRTGSLDAHGQMLVFSAAEAAVPGFRRPGPYGSPLGSEDNMSTDSQKYSRGRRQGAPHPGKRRVSP
jgi:hypothetical protein